MVAITGSWKAQFAGNQILASQQGTGYNPIHAVRAGAGRNTAPDGNPYAPIDESLTTGESEEDYGYMPEDETSVLWGYGTETGLADTFRLGQDADITSGTTNIPSTGTPYPPWGPYPQGVPGGTVVRAEDHGAEVAFTAKAQQYESAAGGWINKETSEVNDAGISDPSQYIMQTSMVQRDKVRAGSQVATGRESEYDAPIASRIMAMIEKKFSDDPDRRYDMSPKEQNMVVRPWYLRSAGTGDANDMLVNEVMFSNPLTRKPPDNPYTGEEVNPSVDQFGYTTDDLGWGY